MRRALVLAVLLTMGACADAGADRTGGNVADDEQIVLTFSNTGSPGFPPAQAHYARAVEELSGGTIRFELTGNNRDGVGRADERMIEDVRDGVVDLAIIVPRAVGTPKLDRLAALTPPMLIDSYELLREYFTTELPTRFLPEPDELGVVAIAVIPGPLQKLVGFDRTFRDVDDFAGSVISAGGRIGADAAAALGATQETWIGGTPFTGFSGLVISVGGMFGRHVELEAQAVTGNLNVFAVPFLVIVNVDVFDALGADQQAAFRDAAPASADDVIDAMVAGQAQAMQSLCAAHLEIVTATDEQLANIRAALDPVYDALSADAGVAAHIDQVEQLKATLAAPPDAISCEASPESSSSAG